MARINFITQRFDRTRFTGGAWCILEYAAGLVERGHAVCIVPILPSVRPRYFPRPIGDFITNPLGVSALATAVGSVVGGAATVNRAKLRSGVADMLYQVSLWKPTLMPLEIQSGISLAYIARNAPVADVHVATSMDTARPTALLPHGRGFYFAQHLETLLAQEFANPAWAALEARQSYRLGLQLIANSPWLRDQLEREAGTTAIPVCSNGINHSIFTGEPKDAAAQNRTTVISYGGRNAEWKGFSEMCEAVAAARRASPGQEIVWQVYGSALLPPDNPIASYESLGFLQPPALAEAYRRADILLSASWYESFPLFPIEAMACGLAVITTQPGTEAYAIPGQTAEVVEPRNPAALSCALIRLIQDGTYRARLAANGHARSQEFTWPRAVATLESILLGS